MTPPLEFDYEAKHAFGVTTENLVLWIEALHTELADSGAWDKLSDEMHQQLMILAGLAQNVRLART